MTYFVVIRKDYAFAQGISTWSLAHALRQSARFPQLTTSKEQREIVRLGQ